MVLSLIVRTRPEVNMIEENLISPFWNKNNRFMNDSEPAPIALPRKENITFMNGPLHFLKRPKALQLYLYSSNNLKWL